MARGQTHNVSFSESGDVISYNQPATDAVEESRLSLNRCTSCPSYATRWPEKQESKIRVAEVPGTGRMTVRGYPTTLFYWKRRAVNYQRSRLQIGWIRHLPGDQLFSSFYYYSPPRQPTVRRCKSAPKPGTKRLRAAKMVWTLGVFRVTIDGSLDCDRAESIPKSLPTLHDNSQRPFPQNSSTPFFVTQRRWR